MVGKLTVTFRYINNLYRNDISFADFEYSDSTTLAELFDALYSRLGEVSQGKYPIYLKEYNRFSVQGGNGYNDTTRICSLDTDQIVVVYREIRPPDAAFQSKLFESAREELGVRLEFCMSEKCHAHCPHINVTFSGNADASKKCRIMIKPVMLMDRRPKGVKPQQISKAVEFVSEHQKELLDEWNERVQTEP